MMDFIKSDLGKIVARNGILAVILAWSLWANQTLVQRLFVIVENNTKAMDELKEVCGHSHGN